MDEELIKKLIAAVLTQAISVRMSNPHAANESPEDIEKEVLNRYKRIRLAV